MAIPARNSSTPMPARTDDGATIFIAESGSRRTIAIGDWRGHEEHHAPSRAPAAPVFGRDPMTQLVQGALIGDEQQTQQREVLSREDLDPTSCG